MESSSENVDSGKGISDFISDIARQMVIPEKLYAVEDYQAKTAGQNNLYGSGQSSEGNATRIGSIENQIEKLSEQMNQLEKESKRRNLKEFGLYVIFVGLIAYRITNFVLLNK